MAFKNEYIVNVDIKNRMSNIVPTYKQGETAVLKFRVYDGNKLFDLTDFTRAELVFRLPSGESVIGEALLVNDLITYHFTGVEMSEVGRVQTLLSIYSGATMVAVQPFIIHIYDSMKNEDLSYIGILQDLIAEVQLLEKNVEDSLSKIDDKIGQLDEAILEEQVRESNENQRKLNEAERISNESERIISESERVSNENIRVGNENQRIADENLRLSAESARQLEENERITNETDRVDSEITRKANESERVINEGIRVSAELTRDANENQRMLDESARNLSESQRISSESTRESNEQARINAENQRVLDETARESNEQARISNETTRNNTFDNKVLEVNQVIADGNSFLDSSVHKREYSPLTQYIKNNEVMYNGSTWRCMQDCISITPTEGVNWTLVAQRGVDGEGSVSSVNGISPDLSGNVTLDATSLGGVTQEVFAGHANNADIHITKPEKDKLETIESGAQVNKVNSVNGQTGDVVVQGFSGNYSDLTDVPTEFNPTSHTHSISQVTGLQSELNNKYEKPLSGIPSTDLASDVQTSLGRADTALQSVPDASTTTKGITQLNDTLTSTSTTQALTANQGKVLSDEIDVLTGNLSTTNNNLTTLDTKVTTHLDKYTQFKNNIPSQDYITNKATKTELTNAVSPKADKSYVDTIVQSIASGSPKGVYATLSALQTAFPTGNSNIYIVSADGKWYYWNGSSWTAGGVYQSTGLSNDIINLLNGNKQALKPFESESKTTVVNLLDVTDIVTPINGTLTQDNINAFGLKPYGWKIATTGAVTSEIRSTFTSPKVFQGASTVGLMIYIEDVSKINSIELYLDTNGTYNWTRTSVSSQFNLKNGWNMLRWASSASDISNWGTFNRFRFIVYTKSATEYTLGSIFLECQPKAQILFIEDAGYQGFLQNGYPQLKARGIPVTWALNPGRIGTPNNLTESDIDNLANDAMSDFNFHSWETSTTSNMSASELMTDTIKCKRWLQARGLQPKYWWRSAFTQNNAPNHNAIRDMVEAYGTPIGSAGLNVFPFIDRWNVGRFALHGKSTTQIDSIFNILHKTHCLLVCYTHDINDVGGADMTSTEWNYFISKIDEGLAGGWLEGVTYDILRTRYEQQLGGYGFETLISMI